MKKKIIVSLCICICIAAIVISLLIGYEYGVKPSGEEAAVKEKIEKFSSEKEFIAYLSQSANWGDYGYGAFMKGGMDVSRGIKVPSPEVVPTPMPIPTPPLESRPFVEEAAGVPPTRVSKTTAQVEKIDEPDIVKTDGRHIYFSSTRYWRGEGETRVIEAFPPSNLSIKSKLEKSGDLLLNDARLVIITDKKIYGYDVSQPNLPVEEWGIELNGTLVSARLYNGDVYLVAKNWIDRFNPAPIFPMTVKGEALRVESSQIYHPVDLVPIDVVYTAAILDPEKGEIKKCISFVGSSSSGTSLIYMSENALYVTYTYHEAPIKIYYKFLEEKCSDDDLIPKGVMKNIEKVMDYDISGRAKLVELEVILENHSSYLSDDERVRFETEIYERMEDYFDECKRELETTGIMKIGLDGFEISGEGKIPGRPLNQFSLDENKGYLRVATTVGMGEKSGNDIYVLDEKLEMVGGIQDMGITERIYAVRFLGDKGYVVTYRETDPFFVIDLSNPEKPELKGELKIPGYSSYLHPINETLILGIGKEGWEVKVSLFDVSSAAKPIEVDKYVLRERWSDVLETHHAFLIDTKHQVFFLPGREGGYIFSYKGAEAKPELEMVKAVSAVRARRAIYIADYLYVIADTKLAVLDEKTWEKVNEIEFETEMEYEPEPHYPVPIRKEL